eukprot:g3062.t1
MKGFLLLFALFIVGGYAFEDASADPSSMMSTPAFAPRTLVLLSERSLLSTHSLFFEDLERRGHKLIFATAQDRGVRLSKFGEYMYDNLILFAPSIDEFGSIDVQAVVNFVDENRGNLLLAADFETSDTVRDIAAECGVELDEEGTIAIDHLNYDVSDPMADHSLILTDEVVDCPMFVGEKLAKKKSSPILYSGVGMAVSDENILAFKVLTGEASAYSAFLDEDVNEYPQSAGHDTLLVAAIQTRNNARVIVSGSIEMFSNRFFGAELEPAARHHRSDDADDFSKYHGKNPSNREFVDNISRWNFRERGVLRASRISHSHADGTPPATQLAHPKVPELPRTLFPEPEISRDNKVYRVKDNVKYSVYLEEYLHNLHGEGKGGWAPFVADDVQLEFVMLDPYVRTTLDHDNNGTFSTTFMTPGEYGVYKFRIMYRRVGYTTLQFSSQVAVRPFNHDEFERFILSAFPYYTSTFSMMVGVFGFSILFLYNRN